MRISNITAKPMNWTKWTRELKLSWQIFSSVAFLLWFGLIGPMPPILPIGVSYNAWTDPIDLAEMLDGPSQWPRIAVDDEQHLHVIWVESSSLVGNEPDAIYYSFWDGAAWSSPVDVLVSPVGGLIYPAKLLIADNQLQILWTGDLNLFFSTALIGQAQSPQEWSTIPIRVGSGIAWPNMARGSDGMLYVVYVDLDSSGLYLISSSDQGQEWSVPRSVWTAPTTESAPWVPSLCVDKYNTVHVVWAENTAGLGWNPSGIWYSRSLDGGRTWQDTFSVQDQGSQANFGLDSQGNVHLVWNHNAGSIDGRYHMWSTDGGVSWSTPAVIFPPGFSGRTWFPVMGTDSAGTLNLISGSAGERGFSSRLRWSYWTGEQWAPPVPISGELLVSNESPELAISEGNRLNVVWRCNDGDRETVCFASMRTTAPGLAKDPDIEPEVENQHNEPGLAPTMTVTAPSSALSPTPDLHTADTFPIYPPSDPQATNEVVILVSLLPAMILIAVVFVVTRSGRGKL